MTIRLAILVAGIFVTSIATSETQARPQRHGASLVGSHASLHVQNRTADQLGFSRFTEASLEAHTVGRPLVPLKATPALELDPALPMRFRFVRPATLVFLGDLSKAFHARFGRPLRVTSAVRTREYQKALTRTNENAARGATPYTRSAHLTGAAVDITKLSLSDEQIVWMRNYLLTRERRGQIEATEEFSRKTFHVMVLK